MTKLKRVVEMAAGGTPTVDEPRYWDDVDGIAWISIGDMSDGLPVRTTSRRVSGEGIRSKRLPTGAPGTLLFAMYASVGAVGEIAVAATWNQALLGIQPREGLADRRFVRYWLEHLRPTLSALSRSNTQDNLNAEQVGNFPFPTVAFREQRVIADYLDAETARIDALIAKKQQLIQLLEERWRAFANECFTSGECFKVKHLLQQRPSYGVLVPRFVPDGHGIPFIRVNALKKLDERDLDLPEIEASQSQEYRRTVLRGGELLLSVVGTLGRSAVVPSSLAGANIARAVCRLVALSSDMAVILQVWTSATDQFLDQARILTSTDTAQPTLNVGDLTEFTLRVPADGAGRAELRSRLAVVKSRTERVVSALTEQLDLLAEKRQALITAAVTGEFTVPGAA